jgi:hypothetical protein
MMLEKLESMFSVLLAVEENAERNRVMLVIHHAIMCDGHSDRCNYRAVHAYAVYALVTGE